MCDVERAKCLSQVVEQGVDSENCSVFSVSEVMMFERTRLFCVFSHCNFQLFQPFWLKDFLLEAVVAKARSADCLFLFLHPCQPVRSMVRRGWSQFDVPTGWVQIVRGPRPKSVKPQVASGRTGVAPQTTPRFSPEAVVEVSVSKVAKLEKARHGRSSLRGDAGRVEACQVCCSVANQPVFDWNSVGHSSRGPKNESPIRKPRRRSKRRS